MLREHTTIDRHSRWQDVKKRLDTDARYRQVENSMQREDYFIEYCKILKDERRKAKEKERERKEKKEREKRDKEREKREKELLRSGDSKGKARGGSVAATSAAADEKQSSAEGKSDDGDGGVINDKDKAASTTAGGAADSTVNGKGKDTEKVRRDSGKHDSRSTDEKERKYDGEPDAKRTRRNNDTDEEAIDEKKTVSFATSRRSLVIGNTVLNYLYHPRKHREIANQALTRQCATSKTTPPTTMTVRLWTTTMTTTLTMMTKRTIARRRSNATANDSSAPRTVSRSESVPYSSSWPVICAIAIRSVSTTSATKRCVTLARCSPIWCAMQT